MSDFEEVAEHACAAAHADFAFVLTRRGRLVTRAAPRDMPQEGRNQIVNAALQQANQVIHLEMPRQSLVPYGGAAPVDVFFGMVADQAILCLVMSTWTAKTYVVSALQSGLDELDELIRSGKTPLIRERRSSRQKSHSDLKRNVSSSLGVETDHTPTPEPIEEAIVEQPEIEPPTSQPAQLAAKPPSSKPSPPSTKKRGAMAGLLGLASATAKNVPKPKYSDRPPPPTKPTSDERAEEKPFPTKRKTMTSGLIGFAGGTPILTQRLGEPAVIHGVFQTPVVRESLPMIEIGEATLGRESLAAIARELGGQHSSVPEITLGEAPLGRESLAAIEADSVHRTLVPSAPDGIRVELDSIGPETERFIVRQQIQDASAHPRLSMPLVKTERTTQPWVESAADAKRAADAAQRARKGPPDLLIDLEESDLDAVNAILDHIEADEK